MAQTPSSERQNVRKHHLVSLIVEQSGRCAICWRRLPSDQKFIHVDHVYPLSAGGTHDRSNLAVVCSECNQKKGNKLPDGRRLGRRKSDDVDLPISPLPVRESIVKVRVTTATWRRWRYAAKSRAQSLSEFVREAVNDYVEVRGR